MISLDVLAPSFQFLEKKGFVDIFSEYKKSEFGNAILILKGSVFLFRAERDRGQVFFDLGVNSSEWYKLEYVLEYIDSSITQKQLGEPPDPIILAIHFERLIEEITNLFTDDNQILELRQFVLEKSNSMINELFEKSLKRL